MDSEAAIELADHLILTKTGKPMNDLQRLVFRGAWQGKSFAEIHRDCRERCGLGHLMRNVGPDLWQLLSEAIGIRVTKNNLQASLALVQRQQNSRFPSLNDPQFPLNNSFLEEPVAPYIKREPFESDCDREIVRPGALIRIRAAQEMGKTWLMERILSHARYQGFQTQTLDFKLADSMVLSDLNKFSQWFCASVGQGLGLPNQLADYWQSIFGCNYNSTLYFENYLLTNLSTPLVLGLDHVDLVFERPTIAHDFCSLLRGWHQRAAQGDAIGAVWQKLRLIVVHSTEVYGALDINHSPLGGVGLVIKLPEFNRSQVNDLAQQHQLNLEAGQIDQLMALIGGHPALLQQAFEQLARQRLTLEQLFQSATTAGGPYSDHLRRRLGVLQQHPDLAMAFKQVIAADQLIPLNPIQAFKLESMGLVHLLGDGVVPRCELYRQYFCDRL